ncbi:RNA-directed DNA polymerase from mobile element jockey, partial [Colletotrichum viniferum]
MIQPMETRQGPDLSIHLLDPSAPLYPGSIIRGHVTRKSHIVAASATVRICLIGDSAARLQVQQGRSVVILGAGFEFWSSTAVSQVIHRGPVHIAPDSDTASQTWPFTLVKPKHTDGKALNPGRRKIEREASYLRAPGDPNGKQPLPEQPLPATCGMNVCDGYGFVEYYREAEILVEGKKVEPIEATLPVRVLSRPAPALVTDFELQGTTTAGQMFLGSKRVPAWHFNLRVECASVIQLGNPASIPFRLKVTPNYTKSSEILRDVPQNVFLTKAVINLITTRHSGRKQSQRPISYPVLNSVLPQRPDSSTDDVIEAVLRDQQATPDLDDRLGFLQANVNKNWDRLNDLFEHVKSLDRAPAFIAIQDPPYDFATNSKRERVGYWCEAQHGWPKLNSKDEVEMENNVPVLASSRVAFYVHQSLALASWSVEWDKGANEHYVASLSLDLVGGDRIKVFNAYNRTRNTIAFNLLLREAVADYCILLGDFNLRHRAWSDRHLSDRATKQLEIETRLAGMRCLLKPKDFTFKRGETQTTIDLVFLGERLKDLCELFHVTRPRGFTTDHAVLETVLSVSPDRDHTPVLQIDKADPDVVRSEMATRLLAKFGDPSQLRHHQLSTTDKLDQFAKAFVVSAKAAIDATIPTIIRNPVGQKPPVRTRVVQERLLREEHTLRVLYRQKRGTQAHNYAYAVWLDAVKQTNRFMRIASNVRKRTRSAQQAKDLSGLFAMARSARFYGKIRASPHMPWLKKPDGTACASSEENARCFRDAMWSDTSEERLAPTELPTILVRSRASAASGHALSTSSRKRSKPKKKKTRKDKEATSCTKALELIVNTVLNGWCATTTDKKWRTTLLGLDISGAFNHVNRQELIKVFAEKGIPLWALRFVWSFLSDQCTCVKLPGHTSAKFWVNVGIPQGSPLSPILFALFAAPILDILQRQNLGRSRILLGLSYVDDTYIMVCTDDWEKNCRILEECHQKIVDWATPRGLRFDPAKYNVMHFRKPHGDLNAASAPQNIPNLPFLTEENLVKETDEGGLRILGVQVDHQLTWKWQIDQIEEKVRKKLNQLKRMSTSVSGPNLLHMRQLYLSTIRPIISYACPAWFMLGNDSSKTYNFRQPYIHRLDNLQNECLVTVAGAYKKAPTVPLHKELHVDPIAVYLQRVAMSHRARNIFTDDYDLINTTSFPFKREMTFLKSHPYKIDYDHARELVQEAEQQLRESKPGLADATLVDMDPRKRSQVVNRYIRAQAALLSEHLWKAYRDRPRPSRTVAYGLRGRPVAAEGKWGAFNLKRYKGLSRAQSSILIQCRTGYIGLKAFLHPKNSASIVGEDHGDRRDYLIFVFFEFIQLVELILNLFHLLVVSEHLMELPPVSSVLFDARHLLIGLEEEECGDSADEPMFFLLYNLI